MDFSLLYKALAAIALAATATSCDDGCTLELRWGISVEVRDAATGGLLTSLPHGVARDGIYEDSLQVPGDPSSRAVLVGAEERPGTYEVQIEAPGYSAWDTAGVEVGHDGCHVETASFTARLSAAP
jgi:hypothetical protein